MVGIVMNFLISIYCNRKKIAVYTFFRNVCTIKQLKILIYSFLQIIELKGKPSRCCKVQLPTGTSPSGHLGIEIFPEFSLSQHKKSYTFNFT